MIADIEVMGKKSITGNSLQLIWRVLHTTTLAPQHRVSWSYLSWMSWSWIKPRYLDWWSKYNYVSSAAFSAGIAISAVVIFFTVNIAGAEPPWWGNAASKGCEAKACIHLPIPEKGYFGPEVGNFM
jgi:hypothetical protein